MARTKLFIPNNGILDFGRVDTLRDESQKQIGKEFKSLGRLKFDFYSIRQQDEERFGGTGQTVDLKLRTYMRKLSGQAKLIKIDQTLYEIRKIDPSNDRKSMFWYLSKKGALNDKGQI